MPMPKKGSPAEGPAPSKVPAPEPAPSPPVADAKWSRLQPGRMPKCGASMPATTAPGGGAAEGRRENDQAQNRPAGSRRERHVHVIRYFWCCRSCTFRNPSDRRNCIGCRLPAAGHRLYDPENPLAPSPGRSRSHHRHRTGRHLRSSSRGRSRGRGTAQASSTPGASSSGAAAPADAPHFPMTVSPPPVFNLVFPIANGMALTPAEVAAIVQRTINGRRPVKRRRQANESETSSDGVPGGTLITAVAEAIAIAKTCGPVVQESTPIATV